MKRMVVILALVMLAAGMSWTQEAEQPVGQPKSAVSLQAGGLMIAPVGIEVEFFLGAVGLSIESRLFIRKTDGDWAGALEPGVNLRIYFSGVDNSLFFFAGVDFLTVWQFGPVAFEQGIVKPRAGLGYNWLLGKDDRWRLGLEVGAAWLYEIIDSEDGDLYDIMFPVIPHIMLVFGRTF